MNASLELRALATRYRARRLLAATALVLAGLAAAAAVAARLGANVSLAGVLTGVAVGALLLVAVARRGPTPGAVARHLDRVEPALAESAELLLREESGLTLAERLARRRAETAFGARAWSVRALPDRMALLAAAAAGVLLLAAAGLLLVPPETPARTRTPGTAPSSPGAPSVEEVSIDVDPPAYLGAKRRTQRDWELDVPELALITWSVELSHAPGRPRLVTSRGDSIELRADSEGRLTGSLRARESALYRIVHDAGSFDFHRILVRPDAPPLVTVLRPVPRSVIPPGASRIVPLDVLVRDDHGVAAAHVVATVTSGAGESVRFRERRLALGRGRSTPDGMRFQVTVDLDTLGMGPGDELYFHAAARDNRTPANEGRSETVFIALADTGAGASAEFAGLALGAGPEYFRSQRQIIMDTEKLVADAAKLPVDVFRERSNSIGMDQGLLRLRYGEFTGEEFEASATPEAAHEHDAAENATLLDPGTKATLKGAIAEMWEAELRLRTYRPREALPYEYRALELLKRVQQSSRAYVQRVGFESPPLEPDRKRLTGKLDGIRSSSVRRDSDRRADLAAVRGALARVRSLARGSAREPADFSLLEAAAAELSTAERGSEDLERRLAALRHLRTVADSLRAGRVCTPCAAAAEAALTAALPEPAASPELAEPPERLRRRYFELLRRSR